jgi:hypothetical protein
MKFLSALIFTVCLSFVACINEDRRQDSFTFIDLTLSNGWNEVVSVHLDSNRFVRMRVLRHGFPISFFQCTIDERTFHKIDSLSEIVLKMTHDTVVGAPVPDGGGMNLVLKSKTKEVRTMIWRPASSSSELDSLLENVVALRRRFMKRSNDTSFVFPSLWKLAPIPPLDTAATFVPPIVKSDK